MPLGWRRLAPGLQRDVIRACRTVGVEQCVTTGLQVGRALFDRLGELVDVDQQARLTDPAPGPACHPSPQP